MPIRLTNAECRFPVRSQLHPRRVVLAAVAAAMTPFEDSADVRRVVGRRPRYRATA